MTSELLALFESLAGELLAGEDERPVVAPSPPEALEGDLDLALSERGRPVPEIVESLRRVLAVTPRIASRRFYRLLFSGRDPLATLGDLLSTLANTPMHTYRGGGPHVLIENEVLGRMLELAGFSEGEATLTAGGSLSNMLAALLARNEVAPIRDDGLAGAPRLTAYASEEAHYSISGSVAHVGIGRNNLRRIAADRGGRMEPAALAEALDRDRDAGARPALVVATAGTTLRGAFDPLEEIAAVTRERGVWLHIDAAFGAPVLFSKSLRPLMAGCELADSLTWDAHKMMSVPLTCSALLVRRAGRLAASLSEPAEYLFGGEWPEADPGRRSLQCGRRNDALKLWVAWQALGDQGYGERVDRYRRLAQYAASRIEGSSDLRLAEPPASTIVCFEAPGRSSAEIAARLEREERVALGTARFGGKLFLRIVCVNPEIDEGDLDHLIDEVRAVAKTLPEAGESEG